MYNHVDDIHFDDQWTEYTIEKVRDEDIDEDGKQWFEVCFDKLWCTGVTLPSNGMAPQVGDTLRLYHNLQPNASTLGATIRGRAVNGFVSDYKTLSEQRAAEEAWRENYRREKRQRYEINREKWQEQVRNLPPFLQSRIRYFEEKNGHHQFWIDDGGYELFIYIEATKIANALRDEQAIRNYHDASVDKQKELVPNVAYDQHSGNTFDNACVFARHLVEIGQLDV